MVNNPGPMTPPPDTSPLQASTPRWTWRSVVLAGTVTLGLYLLLPTLEMLSAPPEKDTTLRSVDTAKLPPPPPPPPPEPKKTAPRKPDTPTPELQQQRRRLQPLQAAMNLQMALGDISGDFTLNFDVSAETLGDEIRHMVFEIGDLDEPPRPLARLKPIYPPQARMRKIEGNVVVEFVVAADGAPRQIEVVSSRPGDVFTEAAIRAIRRWRFTPGKKGGRAVATRVRQKVNFQLD